MTKIKLTRVTLVTIKKMKGLVMRCSSLAQTRLWVSWWCYSSCSQGAHTQT